MDPMRKRIRNTITRMSASRAIEWIKRFDLLPDEEAAIIACDIKKQTTVAASFDLHCCPATISNMKARGYNRIADNLNDHLPV